MDQVIEPRWRAESRKLMPRSHQRLQQPLQVMTGESNMASRDLLPIRLIRQTHYFELSLE